jgi:DNA-binding winged helix-turn-helix (wHTH) protein
MTTDPKPAPISPYIAGGPIREPHNFFGREEQLRTIFGRLSQGGSTSLVGQRRSGKTSILYQLITEAAQVAQGFDPDGFVFVYLDPQLGILEPLEFYGELIETLARQVPSLAHERGSAVSRRRALSVIRQLQPRRLVLLIDEFERLIGNDNFPMDFFSFLRGLSQDYVCLVTTTARRLCDCFWGEFKGSPLDNVFSTEYLGSWTEPEFDHFLAETSKRCGAPMLSYKDQISGLAGRFPVYVQMACSLYFEAWRQRGKVASQDQIAIKREFTEANWPYFERIWSKYLEPEERAALSALARGDTVLDDSLRGSLRQKGYVVDGRIFSSALADFVARQEPETLKVEHKEPLPDTIRVDEKAGDVWVSGKRIPPLTNLEYKLLLCLYHNANCICDKYDIVEAVWTGDYMEKVDDSRIAKLVSRLRERLEPDPDTPCYVITVHGRGYKLSLEESA